ncbi:MAG: 3'-5' exonuclease, partial [Longimicrobiales bacterium]
MNPILLTVLPAVAGALGAAGAIGWWVLRRRPAGDDVPLRQLEFVAIDTETTGLDPRTDALVALAAIPFVDGQPRPHESYTSLVNPGRGIPRAAQAIHGITDAHVREAPPAEAALPAFFEACRERPLVAHTAQFDLALISRAARRSGLSPSTGPVLDIGALAHALFPSWWDLSLEGLGRLVELEPIDRHTARGDALTAGMIFLRMIPLLERRGITSLAAALRLQRRTAILP